MDTEIFETLKKRTKLSVKEKRFDHSLRVVDTAVGLCGKFGANKEKAAIAGMSHDMCKELDAEAMLLLASFDGMEITPIERGKPSLLHGRAAAVVLKNEYALEDEEILEAVRWHTFGKPGMGILARILYVADKIEPGRKHVTEEYLARLEPLCLDELVFYIVDENIAYLEEKGETVSPVSYALRDSLAREK
jgi:nicotinate-nucleotide adenylyltransferase